MFRTWPHTLLAFVLVALAGCTLSRPLAFHAVSYNRAVESAQNRMLLLNVVRASERKPMYFTRIGSITASLSYTVDSGNLSLTDLVTKTATQKVTAASTSENTTSRSQSDTELWKLPSVSYANKPTVQVTVQDTQEFIRGTMAEVKPEVFGYYANQGWPLDLLVYLLVERAEIDENAVDLMKRLGLQKTITPGLIENDPEDPQQFRSFRVLVDELTRLDCYFKVDGDEEFLGIAGGAKITDYIEAEKEGFGISPRGKQFGIWKKTQNLQLICPPAEAKNYRFEASFQQRAKVEKHVTADESIGKISILLRSPQGVLYYLGEVLRVWNETAPGALAAQLPFIRSGPGASSGVICPESADNEVCEPLFVAHRENANCGGSQVQVDYEGSMYFVPSRPDSPEVQPEIARGLCHPGRSMQAMTLVSQLLALQQTGKELPGTALVRVVGD